MARLIALDYGKKRTGIAITDPLQLIATPLKTVPSYTLLSFLQSYLKKESVEAIIIGWPIDLQAKEVAFTRLVKQFMRLLKRYFAHLPIIPQDERFTSVLAKESIIQTSIPKKKRREKNLVHAISATFILRSFMEKRTWLQKAAALKNTQAS